MGNKKKYIIEDSTISLSLIEFLLSCGGYFVLLFATDKAIDTFKLVMKRKLKNIKKIKLPKELKVNVNEINLEELSKNQFGDCLVYFSNVIIHNFKKEDLTNFYNNINNIKIKIKSFKLENILLGTSTIASYLVGSNEIKMGKDIETKNIYHELFHMASSTKKESGFSQKMIGNGINEGYTELLTHRYFGYNDQSSVVYQYLKIVVENLEKIVGKEKMESLYLNANLYGLINELKKYSTEEEIMKFIGNTDLIVYHLNEKRIKSLEKKLILKSLKEVNKYLSTSFYNKQNNYVDNNIITKEEAINNLSNYWNSLPSSINVGNNLFDICLDEKLSSWLEEYNKDINKDLVKNKTKKLSK